MKRFILTLAFVVSAVAFAQAQEEPKAPPAPAQQSAAPQLQAAKARPAADRTTAHVRRHRLARRCLTVS